MSRIASPVFNGAPTDKLAPVDVYETTTPELRTRFQPAVSAFGQTLERSLGKQRELLGTIGKAVQGEQVDLAEARTSLLDILKGSRATVNKLSGELQRNLLGEVGKAITGKPIRISAYDKSIDLGYGQLGDVQAISAMLGDLTGNSELFEAVNLGAEAAVFRSALEMVSAWGIPELVDDVLQEIKDEKERRRVVSESAYRIINTADIDSIETFINAVGADALVALYPDVPRQLLQQYRFKAETTPDQYPALLVQLVRVMDKLQPNWFITQRGSEEVWNLALINTASDAARLLFMTDEVYRTAVLIAPHYPLRPVRAILRDMYPGIAIVA